MWGLERLWPELGLIAAALAYRYRFLSSLALALYAGGILWQEQAETLLLRFSPEATLFWAVAVGLTLIAWIITPPSLGGAWALVLLLGSYGLLLRSTHLLFSWACLESAALSGYFFVVAMGREPLQWSAAIRYFTWSVLGSALILMGIAARLVQHLPLLYPIESGGFLADGCLFWGWAIKVGFIPWHFWLLGVYRALPAVWAAWYAAIPKGALLLNLLSLLPIAGKGPLPFIFLVLGMVSLGAGYARAWSAPTPIEKLFWGSFSQAGYMVLVLAPGAQAAGWNFWLVYAGASFLAFLYAAHPWRGRIGDAVGLLLLANLAGLPPVLGFWVKLALFVEAFIRFEGLLRIFLIGVGLVATIAGFAVYGRVAWALWQGPSAAVSWGRKVLYGVGAGSLLVLGIVGLRWS